SRTWACAAPRPDDAMSGVKGAANRACRVLVGVDVHVVLVGMLTNRLHDVLGDVLYAPLRVAISEIRVIVERNDDAVVRCGMDVQATHEAEAGPADDVADLAVTLVEGEARAARTVLIGRGVRWNAGERRGKRTPSIHLLHGYHGRYACPVGRTRDLGLARWRGLDATSRGCARAVRRIVVAVAGLLRRLCRCDGRCNAALLVHAVGDRAALARPGSVALRTVRRRCRRPGSRRGDHREGRDHESCQSNLR